MLVTSGTASVAHKKIEAVTNVFDICAHPLNYTFRNDCKKRRSA